MNSRTSFHGDSLFDQTNRLAMDSLANHQFPTFGHKIEDPHRGIILHSAGQLPAMRIANALRDGQQHRDNQQQMARYQRREEAQFHQWAIRKGQAEQQIRSIPTPASFSIGRSRTDSGRLRDERAERLRAGHPVTMSAAQAARLANELNPPHTVERVDTAEEFEKLPTGTVVRNGRYKGIKLAEVRADLHNGIIIQTFREYQLYMLQKYPYTAAMHLTDPGKMGPWLPQAVAFEASGSVDALFTTVSMKAGLGMNSYQVMPYLSVGLGGGPPGLSSLSHLAMPGFGSSVSMTISDKASDLTRNHNLNPLAGPSLGHSANLGPLALGYSQSILPADGKGIRIDETGYTNYSVGLGSGLGYRREFSNTYFLFNSPITIHPLPGAPKYKIYPRMLDENIRH